MDDVALVEKWIKRNQRRANWLTARERIRADLKEIIRQDIRDRRVHIFETTASGRVIDHTEDRLHG